MRDRVGICGPLQRQIFFLIAAQLGPAARQRTPSSVSPLVEREYRFAPRRAILGEVGLQIPRDRPRSEDCEHSTDNEGQCLRMHVVAHPLIRVCAGQYRKPREPQAPAA